MVVGVLDKHVLLAGCLTAVLSMYRMRRLVTSLGTVSKEASNIWNTTQRARGNQAGHGLTTCAEVVGRASCEFMLNGVVFRVHRRPESQSWRSWRGTSAIVRFEECTWRVFGAGQVAPE
ncbi:hypothetical protein BJ138DRAFT_1165022 [Hygrophoropsis aurantiaca]|uniref:Uncharacterized protein n=1 Tax=Hygrophoropsis aurantiaca TaxID=72124 RepID=A0ACB7ZX61_9AGAM|nr:hypothetical protein BJ138DRAFT_1165022 [Hygrophoropsis aurantiaca]